MLPPDYQRLEHILDYCSDIENAMERFGQSLDDLSSDTAYQQSVSFCVLQIGELANGLSEDFRMRTEDAVPWRQIGGMRNVVAHNYGNVSLEMLWETMNSDIPALKVFCKKCLDDEDGMGEPGGRK